MGWRHARASHFGFKLFLYFQPPTAKIPPPKPQVNSQLQQGEPTQGTLQALLQFLRLPSSTKCMLRADSRDPSKALFRNTDSSIEIPKTFTTMAEEQNGSAGMFQLLEIISALFPCLNSCSLCSVPSTNKIPYLVSSTLNTC